MAVGEYLSTRDAEVKVRKSRPDMYKRGHGGKAPKKKPSKVEKKAKVSEGWNK